MNDISVEPSNNTPRPVIGKRGNSEWVIISPNVKSTFVIDEERKRSKKNRSKHKTCRYICVFALFTIISMTIGIIIVCLTEPKQSKKQCIPTFNRTAKHILNYDTRPKHVAIGDFNEDFKEDLVVANSGIDSIGILLINDNETLTIPKRYSTGKGSIPYWVVVGRFNNDTALDIAVANYGTHNIGVFLGHGNGTFADQMTFSLNASRPLALAVGDFNNDIYLDIVVVSNGTFYLTLLLGDGNGSFSVGSEYYIGYDSMPCSLAVKDFNNDGRYDIVTTNYGTNDIAILLATDNGTFIINKYSTGIGSHPCSVAVDDFNNDGYIDIAVANYGTNNIGILLGHRDGTFENVQTYSTGSNSRLEFIVIGFINDDSAFDLIVANSADDTIIAFEGDNKGAFVMKTNQSTGYKSYPCSIATTDIDNDGYTDIIVSNLNNDYVLVFTSFNHRIKADQTTYSTGDDSYPNSVAAGDFNNDGLLDIAVANKDTDNIGIFIASGNGTFKNQMTYPMKQRNSGLSSIGVGDFNMDKYLDIAVAANRFGLIEIYLGQGTGSFQYNNSLGYDLIVFFPNSLAIGDFNNDTYLDMVVTNCNDDNLFVFLGNGDGTFQGGKNYSTEKYVCPIYVSIGDFNNDNVLDFASANYDGQSVSIFIGYRNGTFQRLTTISFDNYYPRWLVIGDLNNDKNQDIVITDPDDSSIGTLLGNGNGTFQDIYKYYTGYDDYLTSVVLGDFNEDNKTDIVAIDGETANIVIFLGNNFGGFIVQNSISITDASYPHSMTTGDFNNDKQIDIVVGNTGTNDISVLLFTYLSEFTNHKAYYQGSGSYPSSLTTADFNNDHQMDIVVVNSGNDTIQLLIGYQSNGTFIQNITYATGINSYPRCVVTGDFNKDNYTDIAVVTSYTDTLMIFLLSNDGTLLRSYEYSTGSRSLPHSLAVGDFNEDGWLDIAVANTNTDNVGVSLGYNYPSFANDSLGGPQRGSKPFSIIVADFNNDFRCDMAVAYRQSGSIGIFLGDGNGTFPDQWLYPADSFLGVSSLAVGYINNDDVLDIVAANRRDKSICILFGYGNGTFAQYEPFFTDLTSLVSIAVSDFNNDTKQDLVVADSVDNNIVIFFGYGNGSFVKKGVYSMSNGSSPVWVVISDFNNDNKRDIAVANRGANNIGILLGYGNGNFTNATMFSTGNNSGPTSIDVGDFNKDTCTDIAVANQYDRSVSILLGDCTGNFSLQATYSIGIRSVLFSITVGDLNKDTLLDIAVTDWNPAETNVGILYGMTNGSFLVSKRYSTGFSSEPTSVAMCDFNNDGKLDFAVTNSKKNTVTVMLQNGSEPFGRQVRHSTDIGSRPYSVAVSDFDNDGRLDIVVTQFQTNEIRLFFGYGDGSFKNEIPYSTGNGSRPVFVTTGYINNDIYSDIVVVNSETNNIGILYGYGNRTFGKMQIHSTDPSLAPTSVALAKLDKDNYTDIVVTNYVTNNVLVFYGYGNGTFKKAISFSLDFDDDPTSVTIGDYNNDSLLDIAVSNYMPGYVEVLLGTC